MNPTLLHSASSAVISVGTDNGGKRRRLPTETGFTDVGNAARFARLHAGNIRFCYEWNSWLVWEGTHWARSRDKPVEMAKQVARSLYREASETPDSSRRQQLIEWGGKCESQPKIKSMLELAKSIPSILVKADDFDRDVFLLNTLNGTIDLLTGELKPHRREDLITKLAPVKYEYKPHAPDLLDCPQWLSFLENTFERDVELMAFIKRWVGYLLTGDASERVIGIGFGGGRNGKTVFVETIRALLGDDYAFKLPMQSLLSKRHSSVPNDLAALRGIRFAYASESDENRRLAESLVKDLTGNERISARFLFSEFFNFRPQFKLFLSTNHKPIIRGTDDAIWDRVRLIPFNYRVPVELRINNFHEKLISEESAGILRWAVEGCLEWKRFGLGTSRKVIEATNDYRSEMDIIGNFIEECCVKAESMSVSTTVLHDTYVSWSDDRNMTSRELSKRLKERGLAPPERGTGGYYRWLGLGLKDSGN